MPLIAYASKSDLIAWLPDTVTIPANGDQLLRSASIRVAWACNRDPYTDQPDASAAEPLRDATTAAVAAWLTLGIDPNAGGLDLQLKKQIKLLSGSVDYDTTGRLTAQQAAAAQIGEEARQLLLAAGLLWQPTARYDEANAGLASWGLQNPWPLLGMGFDQATAMDAYGDVLSEERVVVIENPGNAV